MGNRSSRDRHPSRHSSPDRSRRSPTPPKLLSYWEDDDFADLQSFDENKRQGDSAGKIDKNAKENPLPRLGGDFDFYCYDQDGSNSDEEFNLKYQSYYDMMEAGDPIVSVGKEQNVTEGNRRKSKSEEREKGKGKT